MTHQLIVIPSLDMQSKEYLLYLTKKIQKSSYFYSFEVNDDIKLHTPNAYAYIKEQVNKHKVSMNTLCSALHLYEFLMRSFSLELVDTNQQALECMTEQYQDFNKEIADISIYIQLVMNEPECIQLSKRYLNVSQNPKLIQSLIKLKWKTVVTTIIDFIDILIRQIERESHLKQQMRSIIKTINQQIQVSLSNGDILVQDPLLLLNCIFKRVMQKLGCFSNILLSQYLLNQRSKPLKIQFISKDYRKKADALPLFMIFSDGPSELYPAPTLSLYFNFLLKCQKNVLKGGNQLKSKNNMNIFQRI